MKSTRHENTGPLVYAVGGGKGGVGKSFLTTNLATAFAKKDHKTLILDLDFGGANSHTYLEVRSSKHNVFDFLSGKVARISEIIQPTQFKNLFIITAKGEWHKEDDSLYQKVPELLNEVKKLNFDTVFLDLGAGTHNETLSGFLEADFKITLVTPEPTSVENTHYFLKKAFFTQLKLSSKKFDFSDQINSVLKNKDKYKITKPSALLEYIESEYGKVGKKVVEEVKKLSPLFVINQCRTPEDLPLGKSLSQISRNYFGLEAKALGGMSYDNNVWQAVRSMKPLSVDYPNCSVLTEIEQIYNALKDIEKNSNQAYPLAS